MSDPFELRSDDKYTSKVGSLVAQLTLTKHTILNKVLGLSVTQLDTILPCSTNTIGTLLMHMSAMEKLHFNIIFLNRTFNSKEKEFWNGTIPGEFLPGSIQGHDINYYSEIWHNVRGQMLKCLENVEDKWLYNCPMGKLSNMGNNYYLIFHIMEDQLAHYGQIKSMMKRL